jgi:hypothetical protein
MIEIDIEVREGETSFRTAVRAESILHAGDIARDRYCGSEVAVVFPIDPDRFFGVDAAEPNLVA